VGKIVSDKVNDLGFWDAGVGFLQGILEFVQRITGSYGIAIIVLTIGVRLLLYPLSQKQLVSMSQMQKIQPRIKMLQEKYENDKQTLQQEIMRLYKENNVNPFAGCLPLLIQLPVMILLFQALMKLNYEIADSTFLGIRMERSVLYGMGEALSILPQDGSAVGILAVLSGIASGPAGLVHVGLYMPSLIFTLFICFITWLQQKISGAANNPQMATMNVIMPFFMGFICLSLPGGVLVYWGTSSLIGIAQQWFAVRKTKEQMATKPTLYKSKPLPGRQAQSVEWSEGDDDEYEDDDEYDDDDEYEDDDEDEKSGEEK
jgi:YidC/Oxa1 family membrane protein insertase